ncbi:hypothetical protein OFM39_37160, partial [Escherichia coli]|nr:hypothetical protein [Escherichia coli]
NQLDGSDKYEILDYQEKVKTLTVKDLQNVAKKYLSKGKIIATLMPEDGWEQNAKKQDSKPAVKPGVAN